MLKSSISVNGTEIRAQQVLQELLLQIPDLKVKALEIESEARDSNIDIVARVEVAGQSHFLVCEVKRTGQPRQVRDAIYRLRNYIAHLGKPATPVFIAPYLSHASRELCLQNNISFLDFEGNARLAFSVASNSIFEGIHISRCYIVQAAHQTPPMLRRFPNDLIPMAKP